MKKNLYLLGVLSLLLLGTYFFQERKTSKEFEESLTRDHLITVDQFKKISWGDVEAERREDQWWAAGRLLSHNQFKEFEKKISNIKMIKLVDGSRSHYFKSPINFRINDVEWTIGDVTLDKQGFYLAQGNKLMVVVIEGETGELTDDEMKLAQIKLDDLKKIFSLNLADLVETQLFRYYPHLPVGKAIVEYQDHIKFELDFLSNKTLPPPINGIKEHDKLVEKFKTLLTQVTIKKEVPFTENLKHTKLGKIIFQREDQKVFWELWLGPTGSADPYIIDPIKKVAWQMIGGTLKVFFIQVQDYWDKKVIPQNVFENFTKLKTTFIQGRRSAIVEVLNREPLEFASTGYKVDLDKMRLIFQYIFNLSDKDQADRVSQLSKSERKEILSGDFLRTEVMGQELLFWRKQQELIVVNLTQGFKAHFISADETFRARFEDVLK